MYKKIAMRSSLYADTEINNRLGVEKFVSGPKNYVSKSAELKVYGDLISASVYLNPEG